MASLGLIIAGSRWRIRTSLVARGTVRLRLAGRSTVWRGVFTVLVFLILTLVAGVDLLRRVLAVAGFSQNQSAGC